MKNLSFFLARKYLRFKNKDKNISFMTKVCFLGIFIGTFALMLTLIITNGFEKTIHEKMRGINADVIISAPNNRLDYNAITNAITNMFGKNIHTSGHNIKQIILDKNKNQTVIIAKGIDQNREHLVSSLHKKIIAPKIKAHEQTYILQKLLQDDTIIIGHKTARQHKLRVGDEVTIMIPEPGGKKKILLKKHHVTIAGIFKIGLEEYDHNVAFMSLDLLNDLFDEEGVDHITLSQEHKQKNIAHVWATHKNKFSKSFLYDCYSALKEYVARFLFPDKHEKVLLTKLKNFLPHLQIQSWKELYPALVSSLKLEKYVMFFILALISLVACMNMISLLFMQIQQKRRDVAIFKAMGLPDKKIQKIFLYAGMWLTFSASILGLTFAALAGYLLEKYPFIKLPDVYYVSHLPARLEPEIFIIVFIVIMLLGFFATLFPARRARNINIASVLRQE